jgi:hypothetical protein
VQKSGGYGPGSYQGFPYGTTGSLPRNMIYSGVNPRPSVIYL